MSNTWQAITKEPLKEGYYIRIGQGQVSFWYDNWSGSDTLAGLIPYVHTQG